MKQILQMMQNIQDLESQDKEKIEEKGLSFKDGKLVLPSEELVNQEQSLTEDNNENIIGKEFSDLTRKQKRKVRSKYHKENKKMKKLEKSLKKMYRKDSNLELEHDFAVRVGVDEVEFGEEVKQPPKNIKFEKSKQKVLTSKVANMSEEELKRYQLKQIAIQRNMELQMQKAKQIFSRKKREMQSEYAEFEEVNDWE